MILDILEHYKDRKNLKINFLYSGPVWEDGVKSFAQMMKKRLDSDENRTRAKSIFSIFIEQATNILMYSESKASFWQSDGNIENVPMGTMVFGEDDGAFFVQTGNAIKNANVEFIKDRIDYLNSLSKEELRNYYREQLGAVNDNFESKGMGLGLIEMAKRASVPIKYKFEPYGEGTTYFTLYVEVNEKGEK